jgi:predicted regulator of Ras-like GTPase activity (Roadblock/LC7/MglB family)
VQNPKSPVSGAVLDFPIMTELDEILAFVVEQVDGALVAAVAGMDGLLVEQFPQDEPGLGSLAAELTTVINSCSDAMSGPLEAGELRELVVGCEKRVAYARMLGSGLFCLILLEADGNLGKARLYGGQASQKLVEVLA